MTANEARELSDSNQVGLKGSLAMMADTFDHKIDEYDARKINELLARIAQAAERGLSSIAIDGYPGYPGMVLGHMGYTVTSNSNHTEYDSTVDTTISW